MKCSNPPLPYTGNQPSVDPEQEDVEQAEEERGDRLEEGRRHHDESAGGAAFDGGDRPERYREAEPEDEGRHGQLQSDAHTFDHQIARWLQGEGRGAEVAPRDAVEMANILHQNRVVGRNVRVGRGQIRDPLGNSVPVE